MIIKKFNHIAMFLWYNNESYVNFIYKTTNCSSLYFRTVPCGLKTNFHEIKRMRTNVPWSVVWFLPSLLARPK